MFALGGAPPRRLCRVDPGRAVLPAVLGGRLDLRLCQRPGRNSTGRLRRATPADVAGYRRFLAYSEEVFAEGYVRLGAVPFLSFSQMVRAGAVSRAAAGMAQRLRHRLALHRRRALREAFSFHSLLVGGNPFATSSIYTLIHALERRWGVWFPRGGTGALIRGLVRRFEELGGRVRLNAPVMRIETANGRAVGVTTADGWSGRFDAVASNADIVHTYSDLLRDNPRGGQMTARLRRKRFSMSLFVVYFGLRRHRPEIHHHTVLFGPRYRGLIDDIFNRETLAEDFSLYLHAPCATDPSLAPPGAGSFYVLAPGAASRQGANRLGSRGSEAFAIASSTISKRA